MTAQALLDATQGVLNRRRAVTWVSPTGFGIERHSGMLSIQRSTGRFLPLHTIHPWPRGSVPDVTTGLEPLDCNVYVGPSGGRPRLTGAPAVVVQARPVPKRWHYANDNYLPADAAFSHQGSKLLAAEATDIEEIATDDPQELADIIEEKLDACLRRVRRHPEAIMEPPSSWWLVPSEVTGPEDV